MNVPTNTLVSSTFSISASPEPWRTNTSTATLRFLPWCSSSHLARATKKSPSRTYSDRQMAYFQLRVCVRSHLWPVAIQAKWVKDTYWLKKPCLCRSKDYIGVVDAQHSLSSLFANKKKKMLAKRWSKKAARST